MIAMLLADDQERAPLLNPACTLEVGGEWTSSGAGPNV
jgi:hypothetical protein